MKNIIWVILPIIFEVGCGPQLESVSQSAELKSQMAIFKAKPRPVQDVIDARDKIIKDGEYLYGKINIASKPYRSSLGDTKKRLTGYGATLSIVGIAAEILSNAYKPTDTKDGIKTAGILLPVIIGGYQVYDGWLSKDNESFVNDCDDATEEWTKVDKFPDPTNLADLENQTSAYLRTKKAFETMQNSANKIKKEHPDKVDW